MSCGGPVVDARDRSHRPEQIKTIVLELARGIGELFAERAGGGTEQPRMGLRYGLGWRSFTALTVMAGMPLLALIRPLQPTLALGLALLSFGLSLILQASITRLRLVLPALWQIAVFRRPLR